MGLVEDFMHNGQPWKRITHESSERFLCAVDLGCSIDPTAICIARAGVEAFDSFTVRKRKDKQPTSPSRTSRSTSTLCIWSGCR
jgi:hypothetical protein